MQTLRVGIVGAGWGARVHVPAFRAAEGYEPVALCGRDPHRTAAAAARTGIGESSTDWRAFVERDDLDIVVVATPVASHFEIAMVALNAGKHVLCEKPLAATAEDARALVTASERAGTCNAICFETRWATDRRPIIDAVRADVVGDPYVLRVSQSAAYWHPTHDAQAGWMYRAADGGGYLLGLGPMHVDLAMVLLGPAEQVCAEVRTSVREHNTRDDETIHADADDTYAIVMRHTSGALSVIDATMVALGDRSFELSLFGERATLRLSGRGDRCSISIARPQAEPHEGALDHAISGIAEYSTIPEIGLVPSLTSAMTALLDEWRCAIAGLASEVPTFAAGLEVQLVLDAARRSSAGAGWTEVATA